MHCYAFPGATGAVFTQHPDHGQRRESPVKPHLHELSISCGTTKLCAWRLWAPLVKVFLSQNDFSSLATEFSSCLGVLYVTFFFLLTASQSRSRSTQENEQTVRQVLLIQSKEALLYRNCKPRTHVSAPRIRFLPNHDGLYPVNFLFNSSAFRL